MSRMEKKPFNLRGRRRSFYVEHPISRNDRNQSNIDAPSDSRDQTSNDLNAPGNEIGVISAVDIPGNGNDDIPAVNVLVMPSDSRNNQDQNIHSINFRIMNALGNEHDDIPAENMSVMPSDTRNARNNEAEDIHSGRIPIPLTPANENDNITAVSLAVMPPHSRSDEMNAASGHIGGIPDAEIPALSSVVRHFRPIAAPMTMNFLRVPKQRKKSKKNQEEKIRSPPRIKNPGQRVSGRIMTRQTLRIFRDHFGVDECGVLIKKDPRVEFLCGATAPARIIARRGTISCDHQPDENTNENMARTAQPRRITARRARHIGDRLDTQMTRSVPDLMPLQSSSTNSGTRKRRNRMNVDTPLDGDDRTVNEAIMDAPANSNARSANNYQTTFSQERAVHFAPSARPIHLNTHEQYNQSALPNKSILKNATAIQPQRPNPENTRDGLSVTSGPGQQMIPSEVRDAYLGPNMFDSMFSNSEYMYNTPQTSRLRSNRAGIGNNYSISDVGGNLIDPRYGGSLYRSSPPQQIFLNPERIEYPYLNTTRSRMAPPQSRILRNLPPEQLDQQMRSTPGEFGFCSGSARNEMSSQYSGYPHAHQMLSNQNEEYGDLNSYRNRMALAQSRILRNIPLTQQTHANTVHSDIAGNQMAPQYSRAFVAPSDWPSQSRISLTSSPVQPLPSNLQEAEYSSPYSNATERRMASASIHSHSSRNASENSENENDVVPNMLNDPIEFAKWCQKKLQH